MNVLMTLIKNIINFSSWMSNQGNKNISINTSKAHNQTYSILSTPNL